MVRLESLNGLMLSGLQTLTVKQSKSKRGNIHKAGIKKQKQREKDKEKDKEGEKGAGAMATGVSYVVAHVDRRQYHNQTIHPTVFQ